MIDLQSAQLEGLALGLGTPGKHLEPWTQSEVADNDPLGRPGVFFSGAYGDKAFDVINTGGSWQSCGFRKKVPCSKLTSGKACLSRDVWRINV